MTLFGVKQAFGLRLARVEGPSMSPTLNPQPRLDAPPPKFTLNDVVIVSSRENLTEVRIIWPSLSFVSNFMIFLILQDHQNTNILRTQVFRQTLSFSQFLGPDFFHLKLRFTSSD